LFLSADNRKARIVTEARRRGRPCRPPGQGFDQQVGVRIRQRRTMLKLSQQELADRLGIPCQQLQKYEKGTSRIAAGRLHMIAQALGASVGCFFAGLRGPETVAPAPDDVAGQVAPPAEADQLVALLLALRLPRAESGAPSAQHDALYRILSGHSQWQAGKQEHGCKSDIQ
jgi:transcriptional regulator with XRE-family HTH domain